MLANANQQRIAPDEGAMRLNLFNESAS